MLLNNPYRFAFYLIISFQLMACSHNPNKAQDNDDSQKSKTERIRSNFERINSKTHFSKIDTFALDESTDGGEVLFFEDSSQLEKVVARHYGESGKNIDEFYLENNQLSFVLEKDFHYNRPYYMDSLKAKELGDTEYFDDSKTKIHDIKSYFDKNQLFFQINVAARKDPASQNKLIKENSRIHDYFKHLLNVRNKK